MFTFASLSRSSVAGLFAMALAACSMVGCANDIGDDEEMEDGPGSDDEGEESGNESAISVAGRWQISAEALAGGRAARHGLDPASGPCAGRMLDGTKKLKRHVEATFPSLIASPGRLDNGTILPAVQGYNCRTVRGGNSTSMHGMGRALDIFIPRSGGKADNTKGDQIANYMVKNAAQLGVQYVIWDRSKWSVETKALSAYTGQHAHDDHVHVEIIKKAAAMQLDWYK